jgi:hypothetical protein
MWKVSAILIINHCTCFEVGSFTWLTNSNNCLLVSIFPVPWYALQIMDLNLCKRGHFYHFLSWLRVQSYTTRAQFWIGVGHSP